MRKTLANLEREEAAIASAFKEGTKHGLSMRRHLYNIKRHGLYEACGCGNFTEYGKSRRLPIPKTTIYRLAGNGEVEGYIENSQVREFSDHALTALSQLRVERDGKRTHDLDVRKVRRVAGLAIKHREKTGEDITAKLIKQLTEKCYGEKPPKPLEDQLENEIKRCGKWVTSLAQLDQQVFLDADQESPGVVKRLAKAYSELASLLRKVGVQ